MRKFYGFALCAGMASVLAVVYTLLHLDWAPPADRFPPVEAAAPDRPAIPAATPGSSVPEPRAQDPSARDAAASEEPAPAPTPSGGREHGTASGPIAPDGTSGR